MKFRNRILAATVAAALLSAPVASYATAFSDVTEGNIVTHLFRTGSWTKPTVLAVALGTACSDSSFTELANTGAYARVTVNPSDSNWAAPAGGNGTTSNSVAATFAAASANWNGGSNLTHFALYDSATYGGGNLILCAALTTPKSVLSGDQASFPIGSITVQVDN